MRTRRFIFERSGGLIGERGTQKKRARIAGVAMAIQARFYLLEPPVRSDEASAPHLRTARRTQDSSAHTMFSRATSVVAADGPKVPAVYPRGRSLDCFQPSRIGSAHAQ